MASIDPSLAIMKEVKVTIVLLKQKLLQEKQCTVVYIMVTENTSQNKAPKLESLSETEHVEKPRKSQCFLNEHLFQEIKDLVKWKQPTKDPNSF